MPSPKLPVLLVHLLRLLLRVLRLRAGLLPAQLLREHAAGAQAGEVVLPEAAGG